jgi:hypothetical protein
LGADLQAAASKGTRAGKLLGLPLKLWTRFSENSRLFGLSLIHGLRASALPLLALVCLDSVLGVVLLRGVSLTRGMLIMGDLPGFYYNPGVNGSWITNLALYPLTEQLAADLLGRVIAHNLVYVFDVFLPSFGCYALLQTIAPRRWLAVAVSFTFTTFVNPLTVSNFTGGGWFYFGWAFFSFLAIALAWRAVCHPDLPVYAIGSGVAVGLSIVQMDGYSGVQYFGPVLVFGIIGPLYLYGLVRSYPRLRQSGICLASFVASFVLVSLPVLIKGYSTNLAATSSQAQVAGIGEYVIGSIAFTFRQYGAFNAIMDGPLVATYTAWTVPFSIPWFLLVLLALLGGVYTFLRRRDSIRWLALILLVEYLAVSGSIWGIQNGVLIPVFRYIRLLDFMDNPVGFLYAQFLLLPPLAYLGADSLSQRLVVIPTRIRVASPPQLPAPPNSKSLTIVVIRGRRVPPHYRECLAVLVILCLASATCVQFASNLSQKLQNAPSTQGVSPYTPLDFSQIQTWYIHTAASGAGKILGLPDSFAVYTKFWGFIPMDRLYVIPSLENLLNDSYNVAQFVAVMDLLSTGQVNAFAAALGIAGVEYVLLYNGTNTTTIVPNYLSTPSMTVPTAFLWAALAGSRAFLSLPLSPSLTVFQDIDYISPGTPITSVTSYGFGAARSISLFSRELLAEDQVDNSSQVASWIRYPAASVQVVPGTGTELNVNSSASQPYVEFAGAVNISNRSATEPLSLGPNLSVDASELAETYVAHANFSIPEGYGLDIFVAWYNDSSLPGTLFPEDGLTLVGAYNSSESAGGGSVAIPAFAREARLYFYGYALGATGVGSITISSASFDLDVNAPVAVANSTIQLLSANRLESSGMLPNGTLLLIAPFEIASVDPLPPGLIEIAAVSPLEIFNKSLSRVSFSPSDLCRTGCPGSATIAPFLLGFASSSLTVRTYFNGIASGVFGLPAGNFTLPFESASTTGSATWSAEFAGNAVLLLGGAAIIGTSTGPGSSVVVPLPIGLLTVSFGATGPTFDRSFYTSPQNALTRLESASTAVPLFAVIALGVIGVLSLPRRYATAIRVNRASTPPPPGLTAKRDVDEPSPR